MDFSLLPYFVTNVYCNSIFTFWVCVGLVEFFLLFIRTRNPRIKYLLRLVPFIKLPFDLFQYNLSTWALTKGIDLWHCPPFSRQISVTLGWNGWTPAMNLTFSTTDGSLFTATDLFTQLIGPLPTFVLAIGLTAVSCIMIIFGCLRLWFSWRRAKRICLQSLTYLDSIKNHKLLKRLQQRRVKILISTAPSGSPFTVGVLQPKIVIPFSLVQELHPQELESIIAHELEHIRWFDTLISPLAHCLSVFYWCIPFIRFPLVRLEQNRETACDAACHAYALDPLSMAQAIQKALRKLIDPPLEKPIMAFIQKNAFAVRRVQNLISPQKQLSFTLEVLYALASLIISGAILFGVICRF